MVDTQDLTARQRRVLEFIRTTTHERGYPTCGRSARPSA